MMWMHLGLPACCLPRSDFGSAARYDACERTCARSWAKCSGRSFTIMMPREEGPKASVRVWKETVPREGFSDCTRNGLFGG